MRRLQLTAFGDAAKVVALETTDAPQLAPDDLLIKMEAAAINPVDFMLINGAYFVQPSFPFNLGTEGVGRVIAAGNRAHSLEGKRVIILPTSEQGTWAEETIVDQRNIVAVSDEGDPLQLAMLSINPATAYLILKQFTHLMPGDWIGQTAANSAMGQYIIQFAKLAGLKTVNVVRRQDAAQQVLAFGGDKVVLQGEDLSERVAQALGGRKLSLVLDALGGAPIGELVNSLKTSGTAVGYGLLSGEFPMFSPAYLHHNLRFQGFWLMNWLRTAPRDEIEGTYQGLADLVTQNSLSAKVDAAYPLDRYQDALAHAQQLQRSGKVLLRF